MGLRALRPSAAIVKVMSVRDIQCIQVVTPDDHVESGFHEILLHDMGEEELPFVVTSELNYLRRIWPRALFAFITRHQQDLERERKECKQRFGCTQSWKLYTLWQIYSDGLRKAHCFLPLGARAAVALPGYVVHGVVGDCSGLY